MTNRKARDVGRALGKIVFHSLTLLAGTLFAGSALAVDLLPLWESYRGAPTYDTFYTVDYKVYTDARASGALDHGVAAWTPCAPSNTLGPHGETPLASAITPDGDFGYGSIPMQFACAKPAGTVPLYRFYKGSPQTAHVFGTAQAEIDSIYATGYQFERVEGYVYTTQVAGTVPLYAFALSTGCVPSGCELDLRYTVSEDSRQTLLNAGWGDGHVIGYVYNSYANTSVPAKFTGNINKVVGALPAAVTLPISNVSPPTGAVALKSGGSPTFYGMMAVNSTARPAGAYRQKITFRINTGTLFDAGSAVDHVPLILYSHSGFGSTGFPTFPYDGLGIFFSKPTWGRPGQCGSAAGIPTTGAQIFVEEFAMGKHVDCTAGLTNPLLSSHSYDVELTVDDAALLTYKITDSASGALLKSFSRSYASDYICPTSHAAGSLTLDKLYCNNPFTVDRFANHRTGYDITPISGLVSYSSVYQNMHISWLSQSNTVLWSQ